MIRVAVVDDEALVRSGLELILNSADDIEVVATATGFEAVGKIRDTHPAVVLLDIRMPDVDGLTVLSTLHALPETPVVAMLTTFDADEYILAALRSGAAGFLLKDTEPDQLTQSVRTLAAGGVVLSPKASLTLLNARSDLAGDSVLLLERLTDRERDVLMFLAEGLSNASVGVRLHLSTGTVKDHVSAILTKLGVGTRVQAALVAQRAGLLRDRNGPGDAG
ncbi:response regulator [Streptomyces sp. NPDC101234]|uniref:response regulator n=1 Tax=Streptomyces sp. NPDC101234 TaxID=3366138 RepID=UPI0038118A4D